MRSINDKEPPLVCDSLFGLFGVFDGLDSVCCVYVCSGRDQPRIRWWRSKEEVKVEEATDCKML